jgi:hypothetical protein
LDLINNEELSFSYYRSWRWFLSIIESPSNLINRRLHLIIAWPYIRSIFLIDNLNLLFVQQIRQIDEQYMSIQNEFIRFYNYYQNQIHYLIKTKSEYEFICRKNQVFQQIDLFIDNKSVNNLEKYLKYWFHYENKFNFYFQQLKQSQVIYTLSFFHKSDIQNRYIREVGISTRTQIDLICVMMIDEINLGSGPKIPIIRW